MSISPESEKQRRPAEPKSEVLDRRLGLDRRDMQPASQDTGLERRRGPGRRRSDFTKSAEEGEMTGEQFLFLMAIDAFKKANNRAFPAWSDVLEVIRLLGYRKTMPSELNLPNAEDWRETHDAPAGVRPDRWEERARKAAQLDAIDDFEDHFGEAA